jgi:hypothetical protein
VCLVVAATSSCTPISERDRPLPRVDDQAEIFWLDNERVLYRGFADEVLKSTDRASLPTTMVSPKGIRVLNIRTGEDLQLVRADFGAVCYSNGKILYQRREEGTKRSYYVFGPLDGDQQPSDLTTRIEQIGIGSQIRCHNPEKPATPSEPRRVVALLEEHGFVELRKADPSDGRRDDLYLHRDGNEPKLISGYVAGDAVNLMNNNPLYAPWKKAYFNYRVSVPGVAWWLYPDGSTEKLEIPAGSWGERYDVRLYPAKCGLLITVRGKVSEFLLLPGDLAASPGNLGKPMDFDYSRVAPKGTPVSRVVVSPDGTKTALRRTVTSSSGVGAFLEIVDVCR